MIEIESKTKRQELSISKWKEAKGLGTLNLVPRFGKTRIAKLISDRTLEKRPASKILAVAHNDIAYKNLLNNLSDKVVCMTVHRILLNIVEYDIDWDLIIVDEIHRFTVGSYLQILNLKSKFKLGLTGDKLAKYPMAMLKDRGYGVIDVITEEEAIEQKWISDFVEYNLPVEIEEHKKAKYSLYSKKITELMENYGPLYKRMNTVLNQHVFNNSLDLMFGLYNGIDIRLKNFKKIRLNADVVRNTLSTSMGWSPNLDPKEPNTARIDKYFNPGVLHEVGKLFGDLVRERNDLIINSRNKLDAVVEIIKANDVPTIIFSESTQMASDIARVLGTSAIEYHSGVESAFITNPKTGEYFCHANGNPIKFGTTRLKKLAITGLMDGTFKYICTVKALNESVDIPILRQVITTGGTTNPSTHLQRVARGKTLYDGDLEKITIIINVYIKDFIHNDTLIPSRDEGKLKIRQADSVVYKVDSIAEIFANID